MVITDALKIKAAAEFELRRRKKTFREWLEMVSPHNVWDAPHLELAQPYLQRVADGEPLQIMFLEPARHGKSVQNTEHFAAYYLYKNPHKRVLTGAYNQEFCNSFSLTSRRLYRSCMPDQSVKNTVMEWHTDKFGGYKAAGLDAGVTGRGGDLVILDDPVKNAETAYSKKKRDKIWRTYRMDFFSRIEPGGSIILTMTPWHHDGLANRILNSEDGKNWIVIRIPALATEDNDIVGRKKGEALWPWRFTREKLLRIKAAIGDDEFNALYQVNPVILTGNIVKKIWFRLESKEEQKNWPIQYDHISQCWDPAAKKGQNNDYYACSTIGVYKNKKYLLNVFREKLTYPEFKDEVINQAETYNPDYLGIEDNSNGTPLIQEFSKNNTLRVTPEAIQPVGDKELRLRAITASLRNEGISVPADAYWLDDFLDEICLFPQSPHDDQVDAFSMNMTKLRESGYNLAALIGR